ncbi:MAG TPA: hypothetical protein VG456_09755 [Candidatus Sulfopaludibacter sp.]|nr:hypothetical protein [Candidatus Sulfopaludibacter sp.]
MKAELRFVDVVSGAEKGPVAAAECEIKLGAAMVNSGPLSKGALQSKRLPGGTYTVSFPDIDASEWREG